MRIAPANRNNAMISGPIAIGRFGIRTLIKVSNKPASGMRMKLSNCASAAAKARTGVKIVPKTAPNAATSAPDIGRPAPVSVARARIAPTKTPMTHPKTIGTGTPPWWPDKTSWQT